MTRREANIFKSQVGEMKVDKANGFGENFVVTKMEVINGWKLLKKNPNLSNYVADPFIEDSGGVYTIAVYYSLKLSDGVLLEFVSLLPALLSYKDTGMIHYAIDDETGAISNEFRHCLKNICLLNTDCPLSRNGAAWLEFKLEELKSDYSFMKQEARRGVCIEYGTLLAALLASCTDSVNCHFEDGEIHVHLSEDECYCPIDMIDDYLSAVKKISIVDLFDYISNRSFSIDT